MYETQRYSYEMSQEWDDLVQDSDVSHFMFHRKFIEYHKDRFHDHSLLILKNNKIIGCLPANEKENCLYSHQGLSFGGLILGKKYNRAENIVHILDGILQYALDNNFHSLIYKCIPAIYHKRNAFADYYALRQRAILNETCDLSSTICLQNDFSFSTLRKRNVKKAEKQQFCIELHSDAWEAYWQVLSDRLRLRFDKKPVHTISEIQMLKDIFPENIHLACINDSQTQNVLAGVVMFLVNGVAHAQYIAVNTEYEDLGPLDLLFSKLIGYYKNMNFKYFDFGISTEAGGDFLNTGLAAFKEGFGATSTITQCLTIDLKRSLQYANKN